MDLRSHAVALCLLAACSPQHAASAGGSTVQVGDLCVTEGTLETSSNGRLSVNVSKIALLRESRDVRHGGAAIHLSGPTAATSALGSGAVRTQFGLKLRAQDACNLVYVMWRVQPVSELVVSLKSNPGRARVRNARTTAIKTSSRKPAGRFPSLAPGNSHKLRGEIQEQELRAYVDDKLVWRGLLNSTAVNLRGPVGMRTDNAHLEFNLVANSTPASGSPSPCKTGPGESD